MRQRHTFNIASGDLGWQFGESALITFLTGGTGAFPSAISMAPVTIGLVAAGYYGHISLCVGWRITVLSREIGQQLLPLTGLLLFGSVLVSYVNGKKRKRFFVSLVTVILFAAEAGPLSRRVFDWTSGGLIPPFELYGGEVS